MLSKLIPVVVLLLLTAALFLTVGCDKLITQTNNNNVFDSTTGEKCLLCHGDNDQLIRQPQGQWANSRHASPGLIEATVTYGGTKYTTSACGPTCHTSEGFQKYVSNGFKGPISTVASPTVINCFTCHLPHTGDYGSWTLDTLRGMQANVDLGNNTFYDQGKSNMCVICHSAVHVPVFSTTPDTIHLDTIGTDGPHNSLDANLMVGSGGVRFATGTITNPHYSTATGQLHGCLACHYGTAGTAGAGQGYEFGEHTFRLLDTLTGTQYVANCNISGCHAGIPITDFFADTTIVRIHQYGDSLAGLLIAANILTGTDHDSTEFHQDSTVSSDMAKILFNYLVYKKDGSRGIHNPKYTRTLLEESLNRWDSLPRAIIQRVAPDDCAGKAISLANASTGAFTSATWNYGDESAPEIRSNHPPDTVSHTFKKAGNIVVTLTVTGSAGIAKDTIQLLLDTIPKAAFTKDRDSAGVDTVVTFTFTRPAIGSISSWLWNFGDGGTSTDSITTHSYSTIGLYHITLTVGNACGTDSLTDSIKVYVPTLTVGRR